MPWLVRRAELTDALDTLVAPTSAVLLLLLRIEKSDTERAGGTCERDPRVYLRPSCGVNGPYLTREGEGEKESVGEINFSWVKLRGK